VKRKDLHVVPYGGWWLVRTTGSLRARRRFGTKGEAIALARGLAKQAGARLFIHRDDGMVSSHADYSGAREQAAR
jgi:hypothetical protein